MAFLGNKHQLINPLFNVIQCAKNEAKRSSTVPDNPGNIQNLVEPTISHLPKTSLSIFRIERNDIDDLYFWKKLLLMSTTNDDVTPLNAFHIWFNAHLQLFPTNLTRTRRLLINYGFEVEQDVILADWKDDSEQFADVDIEDLDPLQSLESDHVFALMGILECFMGRLLTTANYNMWIARRMSAFAQAMGVDVNNEAYALLQPGQPFCSGCYRFLSSKKLLRPEFFKDVFSISKSRANLQVATAFSTTLVYLQGSEMAMFLLIHKYILCENPILLAWNELAKHADKLIAAYEKWLKLGQYAPYCKLYCSEDMVQEFNRRNLSIFCDVAIAIARKEGVSSLQNYRGVKEDEQTSAIIQQALLIVALYGGAQTYTTNTIDHAILIHGDNAELRDALHTGGDVVKPPPGGQDPNAPIQLQNQQQPLLV